VGGAVATTPTSVLPAMSLGLPALSHSDAAGNQGDGHHGETPGSPREERKTRLGDTPTTAAAAAAQRAGADPTSLSHSPLQPQTPRLTPGSLLVLPADSPAGAAAAGAAPPPISSAGANAAATSHSVATVSAPAVSAVSAMLSPVAGTAAGATAANVAGQTPSPVPSAGSAGASAAVAGAAAVAPVRARRVTVAEQRALNGDVCAGVDPRQLGVYWCDRTLAGHSGAVRGVSFCPQRGVIASAGDDNTYVMFDNCDEPDFATFFYV
jgi:hypothetical protein